MGRNLKIRRKLTMVQIMNSAGVNSVDVFNDSVAMNNDLRELFPESFLG
jgi:hypothetical protein